MGFVDSVRCEYEFSLRQIPQYFLAIIDIDAGCKLSTNTLAHPQNNEYPCTRQQSGITPRSIYASPPISIPVFCLYMYR